MEKKKSSIVAQRYRSQILKILPLGVNIKERKLKHVGKDGTVCEGGMRGIFGMITFLYLVQCIVSCAVGGMVGVEVIVGIMEERRKQQRHKRQTGRTFRTKSERSLSSFWVTGFAYSNGDFKNYVC